MYHTYEALYLKQAKANEQTFKTMDPLHIKFTAQGRCYVGQGAALLC